MSGVPHGSILSPTMFIRYTSDLPTTGPGSTDILFTDDITQLIECHHSSKNVLAKENRMRNSRKYKPVSKKLRYFSSLNASSTLQMLYLC